MWSTMLEGVDRDAAMPRCHFTSAPTASPLTPRGLVDVSTLCVPFLPCSTLTTLLATSKGIDAELRPHWHRYQMWLDPYDADIVRRSHALDDLRQDLQRLRSRIRLRRTERGRSVHAALLILRQGARCPNLPCQMPIVRGTARCDFCCYWECSQCRGFRKPGTFGERCAHCGFEDLHPCVACGLRVPRDRERCNECHAMASAARTAAVL